ncbi:MAG: hypothetical protein H6975_04360 [Gammaproteobacteria bacterium]|nr:hypothetical protein [Gammaproteobacteria bacterium]
MQRSPMRDFDAEDQRHRLPDAVQALHACSAKANSLACIALPVSTACRRGPRPFDLDEGQRLM